MQPVWLREAKARARWLCLLAARPYLRNPLSDRGKWYLLHLLNSGGGQADFWQRLGVRRCRIAGGGVISCDLRSKAERFVYLCGEYEPGMTRFLRSVVDREWRFIDVGAHVGKYTVLAAPNVAEVIAIEPNAGCRDLLGADVQSNHFHNVTILPYALDESDRSAELVLPEGKDSLGTLVEGAQGVPGETVRAVRGDAVIPHSHRCTYLKVDVEGLEERVLRGCPDLLRGQRTVVQLEVTGEWLRQAGSSAESLFAYLRGFDLWPYVLGTHRGLRNRIFIERVDCPLEREQYNVLFLPAESAEQFGDWVRDRHGEGPREVGPEHGPRDLEP